MSGFLVCLGRYLVFSSKLRMAWEVKIFTAFQRPREVAWLWESPIDAAHSRLTKDMVEVVFAGGQSRKGHPQCGRFLSDSHGHPRGHKSQG